MIGKTRIILINSVLIVVLIIVYIAVTLLNKPHINISEKVPNHSIEATQVLQDFQSNETQANSKYLDQILQVTGTISDLDITNEKGVISLSADDSFGSILCHLDAKEITKTKTLKLGQSITIKGMCTGYLMDVILVKCVIVN